MKRFAKIYWSHDYGQIVVMRNETEKAEPAVTLFFIPKGLGVCNTIFAYKDDAAGVKLADELFKVFTKKMAIEKVKAILNEQPFKGIVAAVSGEEEMVTELDDVL